MLYCVLSKIKARISALSLPWHLGSSSLPSCGARVVLQEEKQFVLCKPDDRGPGPCIAVQIPSLVCGACPRSSWSHFKIVSWDASFSFLDPHEIWNLTLLPIPTWGGRICPPPLRVWDSFLYKCKNYVQLKKINRNFSKRIQNEREI